MSSASDDAEQIRNLIAEYGRLLDLRDPHGFAALFTEDGEWNGGARYGVIAGPAAIARFVAAEFGDTPPSVHVVGSIAVRPNGDEANAWSRWMLLEQDGAGLRLALAGHYDDVLQRGPLGWRFRRRAVRVDLPQGA